MVQGYYTLEEAANRLGMEAEELNQMAQKRQVRAFADRGSWRFRTQDIEELARQRGASSSPELQLGDASGSEGSTMKSPAKPPSEPEVFTFQLGSDSAQEAAEQVSLDAPAEKKGSSKRAG